MKITVVTVCRNEEIILPFFLRHYETWVDEIVCYDGLSTDRTRAIITAHPLARLVDNDTGGLLDDGVNVHIKNTAYKALQADWFIVVDCDELVHHPDPRGYLTECDRRDVNLVMCRGYNMIGDAVPDQGLLTDAIPLGVPDELYDKAAIFKGEVDIRFDPGCHTCAVQHARSDFYKTVKLLHYKWLSPDYVQMKANGLVMSEANRQNKWGHTKDGIPNSALWMDYYQQARAQRRKVI